MNQDPPRSPVAPAANEGWLQGGAFLSSLLSGTLLGYLADHWLGTEPWLVVTGIVLGSYAGFVNLWRFLKDQDGDRRV